MKRFNFPMWVGETKLQLDRVVRQLHLRATVHWRLRFFQGVGKTPDGSTMPEFERRVLSIPGGMEFGHQSIIEFASGISDTNEVLLVGFGDSGGVMVEISGNDSSDWEVLFDETMCDFVPP